MLIAAYLLLLLALGVYSYSQIDLNLTLLQLDWFLCFQQAMIQLGYFYRPLSAAIFILITVLLSIFYLLFARSSEKMSRKSIAVLIGGITLLGLASYPAFSHDIFNYIFDARIVATYRANPYTATALMFPDDLWTRFMNWTHRTYPYGPFFLPLTIPVYLLGWGKFISTLFAFKALMVAAYGGCLYFLAKLTDRRNVLFFALNPLILYEAVVAGHLDILMLFFALAAYYFFFLGKKPLAWVSLLASAGIKYSTAILAPAFLFAPALKRRLLPILVALSYISAGLQAASREILPHYFIVPLGFTALLSERKKFKVLILILSALLVIIRYYPYLATGIWQPRKIF